MELNWNLIKKHPQKDPESMFVFVKQELKAIFEKKHGEGGGKPGCEPRVVK